MPGLGERQLLSVLNEATVPTEFERKTKSPKRRVSVAREELSRKRDEHNV